MERCVFCGTLVTEEQPGIWVCHNTEHWVNRCRVESLVLSTKIHDGWMEEEVIGYGE